MNFNRIPSPLPFPFPLTPLSLTAGRGAGGREIETYLSQIACEDAGLARRSALYCSESRAWKFTRSKFFVGGGPRTGGGSLTSRASSRIAIYYVAALKME